MEGFVSCQHELKKKERKGESVNDRRGKRGRQRMGGSRETEGEGKIEENKLNKENEIESLSFSIC